MVVVVAFCLTLAAPNPTSDDAEQQSSAIEDTGEVTPEPSYEPTGDHSLVEFPVDGKPVPSPDILPPVGTSAAVEQTPGPTADTSAPGLFDQRVRIYGVFKPTLIYAFHGMESFSQPNESGVTAAGNPVLGTDVDKARLTGQVMQSRFGIFVNEKGKYTGHIEVDFFDSRQPTPFYVSSIRLRFLTAAIALTDKLLLEAGLDNDLHAPLDPHTNNLAGDLYEAGNFGAKREQVKLVYRTDAWELAGAVGISSANTGTTFGPSTDGNVELGRVPTIALRAAHIDHRLTVGASVLATRVMVGRDSDDEHYIDCASGAVYFVADPNEDTDIRFESVIGHNAGNMRTLGLGFGHAQVRDANGAAIAPRANVDEIGGFVSVRHRILHGINSVYAMAGYAAVLNKQNMLPAYERDSDGALQIVEGQTGPGIKRNIAVRAGYELRPWPMFAWIFEGMYYDTVHKLQSADASVNPHRKAVGLETGFQLSF